MNDGFSYKSLKLVEVPCVLCGSTDMIQLATIDRHGLGLRTVGCRMCGLVQTQPRPSAADVDEFYSNHYRSYYQATEHPDAAYIARYGKLTRQDYTAELILREFKDASVGNLLDCGCGEGTLFSALLRRGAVGNLHGVEPDPAFAAYARDQGARDVYPSIEAALRSARRFDAIVLIHVLEHFIEPVKTLSLLRESVGPDGILYVDVPDLERYSSVNDLHVAHVFHFDVRTLAATLGAAGWTIRFIEPHAPPHHPPSLRAVATPGEVKLLAPDVTQAAVGWQVIRRIQGNRWHDALRRCMRKMPAIQKLWRTCRTTISRSQSRRL